MQILSISTKSLSEATRSALLKAQSALAVAQKEATTGRLADVGLGLGFRAGQTVSLRNHYARLETIIETNAVAKSRLSATQAALEAIAEDAESFVGALIGARDSESGAVVLTMEARSRLASLINAINTAIDGAYIFGGVNTGAAPFEDYFSPSPPPSRQSVEDAFFAAFGIGQSDTAVSEISAADMQAFLDGPFELLFVEPAWSLNWSRASSQNITSGISVGEVIETSANANDRAIRKLVSAYVMLADLGGEKLNEGAFQVVVDTAIETAASAIQELTELMAKLGVAEERIAVSNERMAIQMDVLSRHIIDLEAADPYEASLRVASLLTQMETAYALTARLQQMSLAYYI